MSTCNFLHLSYFRGNKNLFMYKNKKTNGKNIII